MAILAQQAAAVLEKEGISCEIVDLRTLNPLDTPTFINSVRKTGRAVVVEECWRTAGLGGISLTAFTKRASTLCWHQFGEWPGWMCRCRIRGR